MFVRKSSPARQFKPLSKALSGRSGALIEAPSSRSKGKDLRRDKRSSRSKSKDGRGMDRNGYGSRYQLAEEEEDVFGMNSLKQKLAHRRNKKLVDNQSMPTTMIDQDVIQQQEQTIRLLTAQLEKEKQKGKQLLKALQAVNNEIESEKQTLKIESRVK